MAVPTDADAQLMDFPLPTDDSSEQAFDPEFAESVLEGLSSSPKFLLSRYFYDERGDRLFQDIMASPEYYLTDSELEIFDEQGDAIAREILKSGPCELIELGSGDGQKVGFLLDAMHKQSPGWTYRPVDISGHSLDLLAENLRPGRPWLRLDPIHGNYMDVLDSLEAGSVRRVFMFLGSNLGNYGTEGAVGFLGKIRRAMGPDDALLIGLDLKKDPETIRAAYNDADGHTREFNLNLLRRINRELGGDFDLDEFEHRPQYDPDSGAARSFLVCRKSQAVFIKALGRHFEFEAGEAIFMEISQKFDEEMISTLCTRSGFQPVRTFYDQRSWFIDQVWRPVRIEGLGIDEAPL